MIYVYLAYISILSRKLGMDCRPGIVEHFTWRLQFVSTLHIPTHSVAIYNIYIFLGSFFWRIENFVLNSYFWNHHSLEQSKILVQYQWILNKNMVDYIFALFVEVSWPPPILSCFGSTLQGNWKRAEKWVL
jgi:hypothetical protein